MIRYLGRSQLAERIGVKKDTLNRYKLPKPDAVTGNQFGWLPRTVDEWNARRPGRGNWRRELDPLDPPA